MERGKDRKGERRGWWLGGAGVWGVGGRGGGGVWGGETDRKTEKSEQEQSVQDGV